MRTIRIVLLDADDSFLRSAEKYLAAKRDIHIIGAFTDGKEGLRRIRLTQPDLVVLGLILRGLDGFSVLRELRRLTAPPPVIVCTELYNDAAVRVAHKYGAIYFLCRPVELRCLYGAIADSYSSGLRASADAGSEIPETATPTDIRQALLRGGLSPRHTGSRYLAEAIHLAVEAPVRLTNLTRGIYAEIAARNHVSIASIERDIRSALCAAHASGALSRWARCPSNRQFLQYAVQQLQTAERHE